MRITTPSDGANLTAPIDITWTSTDPDSDLLTFKIELLRPDGTAVKTMADGLGSAIRTWSWNVSAEASGTYRLKVTTSDGKLSAKDVTENFTIYHAPVVVDDDTDDDDVQEQSYFMYYLIGAIIGVLLFIVIIIVIVLLVMKSRNRKKPEETPGPETLLEAPPPQLDMQAQAMADNVGQPMAMPSPYADAQPGRPGWQQTDSSPVFQETLQLSQGPEPQPPVPALPPAAAIPQTTTMPPGAAQPAQTPSGGRCKQCGAEQMAFSDDGTGSCTSCGRVFVWDPVRAPQQGQVQQ